jgi:hypothetical protein
MSSISDKRRRSKVGDEATAAQLLDLRQPNALATDELDQSAAGDQNPLQSTFGNAAVSRMLIQRKAEGETSSVESVTSETGEAPGGEQAVPAPTSVPTGTLIVEDSAETVQPGQMRKTEFLSQLRSAVGSTAADTLAGTTYALAANTYIDNAFAQYAAQSCTQLERSIRRSVPEAAVVTSASGLIPAVTGNVRRSLTTWLATGEVPGGLPMGLPAGGALSAIGEAVSSVTDAAAGVVSTISSGISAVGNLLFKERDSGVKADQDAQEIHSQLGGGQALDAGVRARMESAFGESFSGVAVHADAKAAGLSEHLNARAFTVGRHIAFGTAEYQPGTLIGDALIAHELAHVMQQRGASAGGVMHKGETESGTLEDDADQAAVGAVISALEGKEKGLAKISKRAMPRLRSGLRLSRCNGNKSKPTLADFMRTTLNTIGPIDYDAVIRAIHAAPVAERQAVLNDSSLRTLINSRFTGAYATTIMSSLLEGSQQWVNPPGNDFYAYFVTNGGTGTLPNSATMNCWESIMYAAYLTGHVTAAWIASFYNTATGTANPNAAVWNQLHFSTALPQYPATTPRVGQLVFYKSAGDSVPGHVLISLGGDQGISLWNQPNNTRFMQRVRITDLPGTIYIGDPPW